MKNQTLLRAMQFNVWLDASRVKGGVGLAADAIIDADADIVSLVEVKNLGGNFVNKLKRELKERGKPYYGEFTGNPLKFGLEADTAILSRFPIREENIVYRTLENCIVRSLIDLGDNDQVQDRSDEHYEPGANTLAVYSLHLEYRNYSSNLPRGYHSNSHWFPGWKMVGESWPAFLFDKTIGTCAGTSMNATVRPVTDPEVIRRDNIASGRPDAIRRLLEDAAPLIERNIPVVVMGDFNEPSTEDWIQETTNTADHNGLIYKWDSTELLKQAGFIDCYRQIYPNPVMHPGYTWPVAAKGTNGRDYKTTDWSKRADERDRIDFIFAQGKQLEVKDAMLEGTPVAVVKGSFVDESKVSQDHWSHEVGSPWPSDHRAVLAVLDWKS